ncbi:DEAD-box type RNA helicase [Puccinia graminis f. sp. tritici]|uniref:DEAD-box type RNA helicase n=1 Tax=Puccinia graminis f. sp. tritici TaxID=56615 RepID=A0A5B0QNX5_PUCGR|nr:DEAD-box type RNA helicase [Puccinia graminis f. sp. tritici]
MESELSESHLYQAFLESFDVVTRNPADQNLWGTATTLGLKWLIVRVQSDLEPLGPNSGYGHLFCDKGLRAGQLKDGRESLTVDAIRIHEIRAFLLRLISFKPLGIVQTWRENWEACITGCLDCAAGHDASLSQLAEKWLFKFYTTEQASTFINSVRNLIISLGQPILEGAIQPQSDPSHGLSVSPTFGPILSTFLSHPEMLTDPKIWPAVSQLMANQLTRGPIQTLHHELCLPGWILLTMNDNSDCAAFARRQLDYLASLGSTSHTLSGPNQAMKAVMTEVSKILNRGHVNSSTGNQLNLLQNLVIHPTRESSWLGLTSILPALLSFSPRSSNHVGSSLFGIPKLILDHITDSGEHLPKVYSCWGILLRQLGSSFWTMAEEASDKPATLDIVLVPSPAKALRKVLERDDFVSNMASPDFITQCLDWLLPFIQSVTDSNQFSTSTFDVLQNILADKLQRSPYDVTVRVRAATLILAIWQHLNAPKANSNDIIFNPHDKSPNSPPEIPIARTRDQQFLRVLVPFIIDLAYESRHKIGQWAKVQPQAQQIIEQIAFHESENLSTALRELSGTTSKTNKDVLKSVDASHLNICISKPVWIKIYKISNDYSESNQYLMKVYSLLIRSLSHCAHIDHLANISWLPPGRPTNHLIEPTITALNNAVLTIRAPLVDALIDLSGSTYGSQLLATLLKETSIIKAVIPLIFSPNDGLHTSSLALVRQWSDCTSRLDCLRALLSKGQRAAFEGLVGALKKVDLHSKILPDAMSLARRFVRCMTDVISIFCSPTDGLLRDQAYVQSLNTCEIVEFWNLMCSSVSNIFDRTPHWAEFWQASEMTEWMRDALMFTEQLVKTFQIFESAAFGRLDDEKVVENESLRSKMVDSFVTPTEALVSWLRLNDPDLLDRSTGVIVQMLEKIGKFRRPLNPSVVDRLARYIEPTPRTTIILTEQQRVYLKNALATHPDLAARFATIIDDEDEIEIAEPGGDTVGSLPNDRSGKDVTQTSQWANIFPQIKSSAGPSIHQNQKSMPLGSSKSRDTDQPKLKVSYSSSSAKPTLASKPAPKRSYGHDSVIGNLRKEMKASRPMLNIARAPHMRPGHAPHSAAMPNQYTSEKPLKGISGPNFRQSPMKNFQNNQSNQLHQVSDDGSEDESEEDVQQTTGLAGLVKAQKGKTFQSRKLAEPRRTIKMFNDPVMEKQKKEAQARREHQNILKLQKLRMQPDFTDLHRYILQWDYNHTGPCPPNAPTRYNHLPPSFGSFSHYLSCTEPLLMCETWQQISQAKESVLSGEKAPIPIEIVGRTSVDDFIEIYTTVKHGLLPERTYFSEADLVLVRSNDPQSPSRCIMAKVISLSRKHEWFELNLRMHFGSARQDISGHMVPKTKWSVLHLCSLSTTHREWAALRSLPYLTLGDDILRAHATPPAPIAEEHLTKVMKCQKVNEPQGRAIISALATPGFSLIQGPPGTGKTSTIVGLIGAFIASRPKVGDPAGGGKQPSITRKILLCAPSNAAVDEVAKRLKEGVRGAQGELIIPKLVRIGADSKVNLAVKDIFIDELVAAMSKDAEPGKAAETVAGAAGAIQDLRQQLSELRDTRDSKQMEAERLPTESPQYRTLQEEVTRIRRKIHELSAKIDQARDQQDASKRYLDAATRKLRMQILQDADVVCSTLSGSGHDYMSQLPFDFETVVIDEACQCVEPASLIPLRYNATQCILVGDPMQLPPTVLSQTASQAGYDQSLFVRMQRNAPNVAHLLSIQYRMHPSISTFPSKAFYDSKLLDGPEMESKAVQPWHQSGSLFPPYAFYHPVGAREERGAHHSLMNRTEASLAVSIYWRIANDYPHIDFAYRVGIITGYAAQVGEIRRQLRAKFPASTVAAIDVNTVDGFQGQEKDIIILSCVRGGRDDNNSGGGIGFLKDIRRMNVALTRAKSSMFIIGNRAVLSQDPTWKALVEDAAGRSLISEVTSQTFYSTSSAPIVSRARQTSDSGGMKKPAVGVLMTPKQAAEQSQVRGEIAKANQGGLKRKISADTSDPVEDKRNKATIVIPAHQTHNKNLPDPATLGPQTAAPLLQSTNVPLETLPHTTPLARPGPSAPPVLPKSASLPAVNNLQPRPKPAPSLFIKKPKRPEGNPIRRPNHPTPTNRPMAVGEGHRSVRQQLKDQANAIQKPNHR